MNSYYTNKIEGQHTRPADIERALLQQFDADKKQARRQRLALAHIQAEEELEGALPSTRTALYAPEFVQIIHANLYRSLPSAEQASDDGEKVVPGGFRRSARVTAGQHLAPAAGEIPELLRPHHYPSALSQRRAAADLWDLADLAVDSAQTRCNQRL
jgi:Fic family protein